MSDKPQSTEPRPDVSRETPEADLLESIIDKSLAEQEDARNKPAGEEPKDTPETPPEDEVLPAASEPEGKKTPPPANKRTSVYRYLLVLFGAAFVLLLLAYFIQQRSSETAISDLRDTMNLSRAELMEEIDALKEEKAALEEQTGQLQEERDRLDAQLAELQEQYTQEALSSAAQEKELQSWLRFWGLEADYLAKDYEACAQFYQTIPADNNPYPLGVPGVEERVDEILETLLKRGYLTEEEAAPFLPPEPSEPEAPVQ